VPSVSPALAIRLPSAVADEVVSLLPALLDDFGPLAIHERDDPGDALHATAWEVHFGSAEDRTAAAAAVTARFGGLGVACAALDVADEGWAERTQAALRAVRVGGVVVAPPWDVPSAVSEALVIIRPSTGFGTGHHASTRLCLVALQRLDLDGRSVIDVGTGSGVLAIAAIRLGAAAVHAVDCDPDALASARENLELNGLASRITLVESDLADLPALGLPPAHLVVANLTSGVLERHIEVLFRQLAPGGTLIAGGITTDQTRAATVAFEADPRLRLVATDEEDGWVALTFSLTDRPR
jgi:ribosomal protein L11 methyltransferase